GTRRIATSYGNHQPTALTRPRPAGAEPAREPPQIERVFLGSLELPAGLAVGKGWSTAFGSGGHSPDAGPQASHRPGRPDATGAGPPPPPAEVRSAGQERRESEAVGTPPAEASTLVEPAAPEAGGLLADGSPFGLAALERALWALGEADSSATC